MRYPQQFQLLIVIGLQQIRNCAYFADSFEFIVDIMPGAYCVQVSFKTLDTKHLNPLYQDYFWVFFQVAIA